MLQIERRVVEFDIGVPLVGMDGRSQLSMLHLQDDLRHAGHSCRRLGMPDIRLDTADRTELPFSRLLLKRLGQCSDFDAVAQLGSRTMTFDVANGLGMYVRFLERMADQTRLSIRVRSGISV